MKIDTNTIDYIAALSKLSLNEEEKEKAKESLGEILDYISCMNDLDTDMIEPLSHVFPICNVFREDIITNEPQKDNLLRNAPCKKDGSFVVPKTVEI